MPNDNQTPTADETREHIATLDNERPLPSDLVTLIQSPLPENKLEVIDSVTTWLDAFNDVVVQGYPVVDNLRGSIAYSFTQYAMWRAQMLSMAQTRANEKAKADEEGHYVPSKLRAMKTSQRTMEESIERAENWYLQSMDSAVFMMWHCPEVNRPDLENIFQRMADGRVPSDETRLFLIKRRGIAESEVDAYMQKENYDAIKTHLPLIENAAVEILTRVASKDEPDADLNLRDYQRVLSAIHFSVNMQPSPSNERMRGMIWRLIHAKDTRLGAKTAQLEAEIVYLEHLSAALEVEAGRVQDKIDRDAAEQQVLATKSDDGRDGPELH